MNIQADTDNWHLIVNRQSGLAMDVDARSADPGAPIIQWARNDALNQQFRFVSSGDDYYRIIARHSGLALDIYEHNLADGADVVQWEDLNGENQQFRLHDMGGGYVRLVNRLTNKALAPADGLSAQGTRLSQYAANGEPAQQWQLVPVEAIVDETPGSGECGSGTPYARVTGSGGNYRVNGNDVGSNYLNAINMAISSLPANRTSPQRVTVDADGSIGTGRIDLPSNIIFEVCGTMNVGNSANNGSVQAFGARNVSIPFLKMTGNPYFGMRFRDVHNLHLGQIDLRLSGGLGIRFDRDAPGGGAAPTSTNVRMDHIYVSGTNNHGVETWHVDGLTIGTVIARNTGYAGLLLNGSRNATIGLVDGEGTGTGTGYATLRFANRNGRVGSSYPTNIIVDRVISRGGARGLFCVSESGGAQIKQIDFANNGNNSVLIENCYNVAIDSGTVDGGGEFRLAARTEFANNRDIAIRNLTVRNTSVRESPCGENISWVNLSHSGTGSVNVCR